MSILVLIWRSLFELIVGRLSLWGRVSPAEMLLCYRSDGGRGLRYFPKREV